MKTILLFLFLLPVFAFSQSPQRYSYRPAPKKGEATVIAGVILVVVAASPLVYNARTSPSVPRIVAGVGGAMMCAGVAIDLGKGKGKKVRLLARR
jgi:hypothetical protein